MDERNIQIKNVENLINGMDLLLIVGFFRLFKRVERRDNHSNLGYVMVINKLINNS